MEIYVKNYPQLINEQNFQLQLKRTFQQIIHTLIKIYKVALHKVKLLNKLYQMNKPIFQKINKSRHESISETPNSQQNIVTMSVQDMQKTLINNMKSSNNQYKKLIQMNQQKRIHKMNESINQKNNNLGNKKIPELMFENDFLKDEIEKLKSQKKLILSKYQAISAYNMPIYNSQNQSKQKSQQFSFRKSVQNIDKLVSMQKYQHSFRQNAFNRKSGIRQQKIIPSSDSNKNTVNQQQKRVSTSLQSKQAVTSTRHSSKQIFSTLEERFYQYCKTQMVRMNSQNTKLTFKIGQLQNRLAAIHKQNQLLEKQNQNLKTFNEELQEKLQSEGKKIEKINEDMSMSLIKKQQILQTIEKRYQSKFSQSMTLQQQLKKSIAQKDLQITTLKTENLKRQKQLKNYAQLVNKNSLLQSQLSECMIRNKKLSEKFRKMPAIDHLWQIKQVEYENLINLIQRQKNQDGLVSNSVKKRQRKINQSNAFDLTFSKNSKNKW